MKENDQVYGSFSPGVSALGTHLIGGWVGPSFGRIAAGKRTAIPRLCVTRPLILSTYHY